MIPPNYEIVKGCGEDSAFVELWDRTLEPEGLAFEMIRPDGADIVLIGHGLAVPDTVVRAFLEEARGYLSAP
jgi:hypothetical protein